jgi:O-antigen/teichoic acid export membrane protein
MPVVFPLKVLCLVSCVRAIESVNAPVVMARGQPRVVVFNTLIAALVLPASFYAGAQYAGINGVAIAWLVTRPFLFTLITIQTVRVVGISLPRYMSGLLHPAAGSLAMVGVVFVVQSLLAARGPMTLLVVSVLVGALSYIAYQMAFNPLALRELFGTIEWQQLGLPGQRPTVSVPEDKKRVVVSEP